jgi:hypothetical protein
MKKLGGTLLLLSAGFLVAWMWQLQIARGKAAHYQKVSALVVANRVHKEFPDRSKADRSLVLFRSEYLLQYTFEGKLYRNWQSGSVTSILRSRVEAELGNICPGTHIDIYVNPDDPRQSTLQVTGWYANLGAILFAILSLFSAVAGISLLTFERGKPAVVYCN